MKLYIGLLLIYVLKRARASGMIKANRQKKPRCHKSSLLLNINPLTDGGGIECPPLAKSAPVHQGLTFEWP